MDIWIAIGIFVVPYLMFFTARAIHRDDRVPQSNKGSFAAAIVFIFPLILIYWMWRALRKPPRGDAVVIEVKPSSNGSIGND